jgi:poly(3-hydroxybutyrate) depolymerase
MKPIFLISFLIFTHYSIGQKLSKVNDFGKNLGNLKMYVYQPQNIDYTNKVPIVFVLHGCTQSAESISAATGWNKLADSLNFVVVYPEQKQINNASKCFNYFIGFKAKKDKGESASIKAMIDYSFRKFNIDSSRVFITGMSAGGAMTNNMLNAYPEIFNAGALIAAPHTLVEKINSSSKKVPKIAILQGDKDLVVPPKNATKIIVQWITKNGFSATNFKTVQENLNDKMLATTSYFNNKNELKMVMLTAKTITHKILINPGEDIQHGGKMGFHTKDIDFHSTYWIAHFFGLTKD